MILADPGFWRIAWKEYRAQRAFWLVVAVCGVVLQLLFWLYLDQRERLIPAAVVAGFFPALFAIGCGAILFAGEKEDGTVDFLRALAASPARMFWGKLLFALAALTVLQLVLCVVPVEMYFMGAAAPRNSNGFGPFGSSSSWWYQSVYYTLTLFTWGMFFSLVCRRVIPAVCCGVAAYLVGISFLNTAGSWWGTVVLFVLLMPIVASYFLTRRLMLTPRRMRFAQWRGSWIWAHLVGSIGGTSDARLGDVGESGCGMLTTWAAVRETRPLWWRSFRGLLWEEWRQARNWNAWFFGVGVLVFLGGRAFPSEYNANRSTSAAFAAADILEVAAMALLVIAPVFAGVCVFHGEQSGQRFRFLSERGVTPTAVWLSKHCVWLPQCVVVTATLIALTATVQGANTPFRWFTEWQLTEGPVTRQTNFPPFALYFVLAYAAGQFASLLLSRLVTAGFIAGILTGALAAWMSLMAVMAVPLSWSVLSVALVLLAATRDWSRVWMLERSTWRAWSRLTAMLLVPAALLWCAIGVFRVYEIPAVVVPDVRTHRLTTEELSTAQLYQQADTLLRQDPDSDRFHDQALKHLLRATERASAVIGTATAPPIAILPDLDQKRAMNMANVLLESARKLERDGQLDEAFERYVAALRFTRHLAHRASVLQWEVAIGIEHITGNELVRWAGRKGQTPDRIRRATNRLQLEFAQFPGPKDALLIEHARVRQRMETFDPTHEAVFGQSSPMPNFNSEQIFWYRTLDVIAPWETARALRVLNVFTAAQLVNLAELETQLARPACNILQWSGWVPVNWGPVETLPWHWQKSTRFFAESTQGAHQWPWQFGLSPVDAETRRRARLILMGLSAWRTEHGSVPRKLDDLTGIYLDRVPFDPWNGRPFEYRHEGFDAPVRLNTDDIPAGESLLWSVGPDDARFYERETTGGKHYQAMHQGNENQPSIFMDQLVFRLPSPLPR